MFGAFNNCPRSKCEFYEPSSAPTISPQWDAEDAVYDYDGYCMGVKFHRSGLGGGRGGGGGTLGTTRNSYRPPSRRSENRVIISGLPPSGSWQDLKHYMREASDLYYADVYRDGTSVVEFVCKEDMTYAVCKLYKSRFRSHEGETAYICVKVDSPRSPSYGRSHSRSHSRSRSNKGSHSFSGHVTAEGHHATLLDVNIPDLNKTTSQLNPAMHFE